MNSHAFATTRVVSEIEKEALLGLHMIAQIRELICKDTNRDEIDEMLNNKRIEESVTKIEINSFTKGFVQTLALLQYPV